MRPSGGIIWDNLFVCNTYVVFMLLRVVYSYIDAILTNGRVMLIFIIYFLRGGQSDCVYIAKR